MTKRKDDMSNERPPRPVLSEGWKEFIVTDAVETVSKAGNDMIIVFCQEKETEGVLETYCITTPKKRWLLKGLLSATDMKKDENGAYEWEASDLIGKIVLGKIKNEDEEWIDREGEKRITKKSSIMEFKAVGERPY